jgi:hypothetical protein
MTALESLFATRASLELAAFFVSWAAIALLVVIVVHLHVRLQRLERATAPTGRRVAYAHLVGQRIASMWTGTENPWQPGVMLFMSRACPACEQLLADLRASTWSAPLTLVYTTAPLSAPAGLPRAVRVIDDGAQLSAALGIHVTPFAVRVGETGVIDDAMPVSSLAVLRTLVTERHVATRPARIDGALEEVTP